MNDTTPLKNDLETTRLACEFRNIPLSKLTLPEHLFDQRSFNDAEPLPLLPPLTVFNNGTAFTVIDGCKRFAHAAATGLKECGCTVISPAPSPEQLLFLRIRLNQGRPFHFFEKLMFIKWLKKSNDATLLKKACAMLPFSGREQFDFEQLAECGEEITDAVAAGCIEKQTAFEINRYPDNDRTALLAFFNRYRFSRQTQRELLDWIAELAFREQSTIPRLLQVSWLQDIENDTKLNPPQKIERIHATFFNRRFPTLSQAKKRWKALAKQHNPDPARVQFKPSEAFEKNRVELKITINSAEDARRIFSRFNGMTDDEWDQLIYPAQFSVTPEQSG